MAATRPEDGCFGAIIRWWDNPAKGGKRDSDLREVSNNASQSSSKDSKAMRHVIMNMDQKRLCLFLGIHLSCYATGRALDWEIEWLQVASTISALFTAAYCFRLWIRVEPKREADTK